MKRWVSAPAIAALFGALLQTTPALADGGNPRAYDLLFDPGDATHVLIHSHYWGLFDRRGGASSWSLLCSQVFGVRAIDSNDLPTVMTKGGRILVAADFNGLVSSDDGCTWKKLDAFNGEPVNAVAPIGIDQAAFLVVTVKNENGPVVSRAYSSPDRGDTWTKLAGTFPQDFFAMRAMVAPSDPRRFYVVGTQSQKIRSLGVSADGGSSFTVFPIATGEYDPADYKPLSIAGVDPTNPDVVFVRADGDDTAVPPVPDELWVSSDAGKTWKKSFVPTNDLPGFAYSPDGTKVLVAGPIDGIKAAPVADAIAGNSAAFQQVFSNPVWGLTTHDGKLYAGTDDFGMKPPYMLGVSTDQGVTFTKVMDHCQVSFPTCAADSNMEQLCRLQWERMGGYVTDYLDMGACVQSTGGNGGAGGSGGNAGTGGNGGTSGTGAVTSPGGAPSGGTGPTAFDAPHGATSSSPGCGCTVTSRSGGDAALLGLASLAIAAKRRRRRQ